MTRDPEITTVLAVRKPATCASEPPLPEGRGFPLHGVLPRQQRAFEDLRSLDGQHRALRPAASPKTDTVPRCRGTETNCSNVRAFHPLPEGKCLSAQEDKRHAPADIIRRREGGQ